MTQTLDYAVHVAVVTWVSQANYPPTKISSLFGFYVHRFPFIKAWNKESLITTDINRVLHLLFWMSNIFCNGGNTVPVLLFSLEAGFLKEVWLNSTAQRSITRSLLWAVKLSGAAATLDCLL